MGGLAAEDFASGERKTDREVIAELRSPVFISCSSSISSSEIQMGGGRSSGERRCAELGFGRLAEAAENGRILEMVPNAGEGSPNPGATKTDSCFDTMGSVFGVIGS